MRLDVNKQISSIYLCIGICIYYIYIHVKLIIYICMFTYVPTPKRAPVLAGLLRYHSAVDDGNP